MASVKSWSSASLLYRLSTLLVSFACFLAAEKEARNFPCLADFFLSLSLRKSGLASSSPGLPTALLFAAPPAPAAAAGFLFAPRPSYPKPTVLFGSGAGRPPMDLTKSRALEYASLGAPPPASFTTRSPAPRPAATLLPPGSRATPPLPSGAAATAAAAAVFLSLEVATALMAPIPRPPCTPDAPSYLSVNFLRSSPLMGFTVLLPLSLSAASILSLSCLPSSFCW